MNTDLPITPDRFLWHHATGARGHARLTSTQFDGKLAVTTCNGNDSVYFGSGASFTG
jgi:hypothetical protein